MTKAEKKAATSKENAAKIEENGTFEGGKTLEDDGVYEPSNTDKIKHNASDQGTATGKLPSLNADGTRPTEE